MCIRDRFSTSNDGIMNIVKPILSLIPFALILSEHKFKTAGKYAVLYAVCFVLERLALHVWSGMISFLILAATSIMTRFAPVSYTHLDVYKRQS